MTEADLSGFSMMDLFRREVETQASILNEGLLEIEKGRTGGKSLEPLMRAAHSVKGAARILQIESAVKVSHAMEDCLVAAMEDKVRLMPEQIDTLLKSLDLLTRIAQLQEDNIREWESEHAAEIEKMLLLLGDIVSTKRIETGQREIQSAAETVPLDIAGPAIQAETTESSTSSERRAVRVTADALDRLMALAGESLVAANWLQPYVDALLPLKKDYVDVFRILSSFQQNLEGYRTEGTSRLHIHEAFQKALEVRSLLSQRLEELEDFALRSTNLFNRMYREIITTKMRPFADGVEGFPRMVRDLAKSLGKKVRFEILGKTTKVDRDILDRLEAPLNHILRNALDHGMETPEERIAIGKQAEGSLTLEAVHRAGMLQIRIHDDGRGIHFDKLRQKLIDRKLITKDLAGHLQENELLEFLFLPGFTTAEKVSEISGRGFGMDIVQSMIREVGGAVQVHSQPGEGMTIHLQLPLTLSVLKALVVEIASELFAFPLSRVERAATLKSSDVRFKEERLSFLLEQTELPLIAGNEVLELSPSSLPANELAVVVIGGRFHQYGIVVDRFVDLKELVVKPIDARLGKSRDLYAASIMEDGSIALILDVQDLLLSIERLLGREKPGTISADVSEDRTLRRKRVLIVEDSVTVREVERNLLKNSGFHVDVAVNGVDGWNAVRSGQYDLVITDIDMPRMNGIELVSRIRKEPGILNLPVIIVSYKDREADRKMGLDAGANEFLSKSSFHDETLLNVVSKLLGEPGTRTG